MLGTSAYVRATPSTCGTCPPGREAIPTPLPGNANVSAGTLADVFRARSSAAQMAGARGPREVSARGVKHLCAARGVKHLCGATGPTALTFRREASTRWGHDAGARGPARGVKHFCGATGQTALTLRREVSTRWGQAPAREGPREVSNTSVVNTSVGRPGQPAMDPPVLASPPSGGRPPACGRRAQVERNERGVAFHVPKRSLSRARGRQPKDGYVELSVRERGTGPGIPDVAFHVPIRPDPAKSPPCPGLPARPRDRSGTWKATWRSFRPRLPAAGFACARRRGRGAPVLLRCDPRRGGLGHGERGSRADVPSAAAPQRPLHPSPEALRRGRSR